MTDAIHGDAVGEFKRKPLGSKSYGSIPHLPGSRLGPGDHHCHEGQARICTERARDRHDRILVQEKLDGSNVGVARIAGVVVPLTRAGYVASSSPYEQHWRFGEWTYEHQALFLELLEDGERVCGEWLMQAHGTRYELQHAPFVAFDLMRGMKRAALDEVAERVGAVGLPVPHLVHDGRGRDGALSIEAAMRQLGPFGKHGALDPIEGAVWRVERNGLVEFLAKYVRPDKADGCYLPEVSGQAPVWNWQPDHARRASRAESEAA